MNFIRSNNQRLKYQRECSRKMEAMLFGSSRFQKCSPIEATNRSKISSSDQKRLFLAKTSFNGLHL